jgi:DNA-binding SARP family transcriptional activator
MAILDPESAQERIPVHLHTFGRIEIEVSGQPVRFGRTRPKKPLALLGALVAADNRPLAAIPVCEALWPDAEPFDAYRSLVSTVYRVRQLLGHRDAVRFDSSGIALNPAVVAVDAWTFTRLTRDTTRHAVLLNALNLYEGEFLPGDDQAYVLEMRERLQRQYVRSVRHCGFALEQEAQIHRAIALYQRAIDVVAMAEDLHRLLMLALLRVGQAGAAAQVFHHCRYVLARRLGVSPSASTVEVFRSIANVLRRDQAVTEGSHADSRRVTTRSLTTNSQEMQP